MNNLRKIGGGRREEEGEEGGIERKEEGGERIFYINFYLESGK